MSSTKGKLFTIAAPSGAGKTSLVKALVAAVDNLCISVSYTTRAPRPGEIDGIDYHFVNEATFAAMIKHGDFLEYAEVFHYHYGTSKSWVEKQLAAGKHIILEIDWQGVQQIKRLFPDVTRIFILPPSIMVLTKRLQARGQDNQEVIADRMQAARKEIAHYKEADFLVVNDDFTQTLADLITIIARHELPDRQNFKENSALAESLLA